MNYFKCGSLGEAWLRLLEQTLEKGAPMGDEGYELLGVQAIFPATNSPDVVLARLADAQMLDEMDKVFFGDGPNSLGHSYANLMRGPDNRHDLEDITALLHAEPLTKRAVVTLCGPGNGKVPCINVIQFLVRAGAVETIYFARGQDAFRKFYADALCIGKMALKVAAGAGVPGGSVTAFVGSSHIYTKDVAAIRDTLERAKAQRSSEQAGGLP
ncbi:MAG TPA: thymidylate synthase [Candidatus Acidoferrum sp.]|jgi:thymidylate synthase|nr:thymidylate synthase [Candidatus Acidoferrum sp.]